MRIPVVDETHQPLMQDPRNKPVVGATVVIIVPMLIGLIFAAFQPSQDTAQPDASQVEQCLRENMRSAAVTHDQLATWQRECVNPR